MLKRDGRVEDGAAISDAISKNQFELILQLDSNLVPDCTLSQWYCRRAITFEMGFRFYFKLTIRYE